jgi:hypothetical protein
MIQKNDLLALFWANANQLVTRDGVEVDLHNDELVVLSLSLKNVEEYPYTVQLRAEFTLGEFLAEMKVQMLDSMLEINIDMLFALLIGGKARYQVFKG